MAETIRIEIPITVKDETEPAIGNITGKLEGIKSTSEQAQSSISKASSSVSKFDRAQERTQRSLTNWMKQKYQLLIEAKDRVSPISNKIKSGLRWMKDKYKLFLEAKERVMPILNKIKSGLKTVGGKVWRVTMKAVDLVTAPLRGIFNLFKNPIFQVGAVMGISLGFKDTVDTFANFESAMSQVKAVSGAEGQEFEDLNRKAKEMGATTKFTATEAAEAFNYMGMAGWKSKQMIAGIDGIMNLAAASGEDLGKVSDIVTDALTAFGLKAEDSSRFADVLAAAASNANTNVGMLGESFKYIAPVAGSLGYTVEDTAIALGLIANSGIKGSMAGTALRSAFINLISPTDKMKQRMDLLGISAKNADGSMKPLKELMDHLREKMKTLTDAEKEQTMQMFTGKDAATLGEEAMAGLSEEEKKYETALGVGKEMIKDYDEAQLNLALSDKYKKAELKKLTEEQKRNEVALEQGLVAVEGMSRAEQAAASARIFGKEAMSGLLAIINASEGDYDKLTEAIYGSEGAAKQMANTMLDNLKGSFTLLQSAAEGVKLSLGERFAPYLMDLSTWLTGQMPNIERGLMQFMDVVDEKIDALKAKIAEFTATDEWNRADFFGKVKIAWDEIIAIPFSEWWDSKGHDTFVQKASSLGEGLGSTISSGILALLGVDISGVAGEGESVGGAFVKGFIDGFDVGLIQDKIGEAISGIFSNAAKILPGGEQADLSSWMSAALIAKIGVPLLGGLFKVGKVGKNVFGNTVIPGGSPAPGTPYGTPTVVPGIGRRLLGSFSMSRPLALTEEGLVNGAATATGSGLLGKLGKLGMRLTPGAPTGAGMVLSGTLGASGAIAGGATLISGISDLMSSIKAKTDAEAAAYAKSGGWKVGGVAGGAAAGAAIGTAFGGPLLGTLIGAGIGGFVGWAKGDKVKEEYAEGLKEAEEKARKLALAEEQAKFKSRELKTALADVYDGKMTNEEFDQLYQNIVVEDMKSHFGSIKLSMQEIQTLAKKTIFGDNVKNMEKYADATAQADKAIENLGVSVLNLDRLNWKAGLGFKLDEAEVEEYKTGIKDYISSVKMLEETQHYKGKAAIDFIYKPDSKKNKELTELLDGTYSRIREEIESDSIKLTKQVDIALEDGEITGDEQEIIDELLNKLDEKTKKLLDAKEKAEQAMRIEKFKQNPSYETYSIYQEELAKDAEQKSELIDSSVLKIVTDLETAKANPDPDPKKRKPDEYYEKAKAEAFRDGFEQHKEVKDSVFDRGVEGLAAGYAEELDGILPEIEGSVKDKLKTVLDNTLATGIEIEGLDVEEIVKLFNLEGLDQQTRDAVVKIIKDIALMIPEATKEAFAEANAGIKNTAGAGVGIMDGIVDGILESMLKKESSTDFSSLGVQAVNGASAAIQTADISPVTAAAASLGASMLSQVQAQIQAAFAPGIQTTANVGVNLVYKILNPTASITTSGTTLGGFGTSKISASIAANAEGDIIRNPLISLVAEDGPEAIIPLGGKRRRRGLELWEKAGEMLGVRKYAEGGIVQTQNQSLYQKNAGYDIYDQIARRIPNSSEELWGEADNEETTPKQGIPISSNSAAVNVQVQVSPSFEIKSDAGNEKKMVDTIKASMKEIADEMSGEIAEKLEAVFANMPVKGWS